jgi:hypothetical protein
MIVTLLDGRDRATNNSPKASIDSDELAGRVDESGGVGGRGGGAIDLHPHPQYKHLSLVSRNASHGRP